MSGIDNASREEWDTLKDFAKANGEKASAVFAEFGYKMNDEDMLRKRVELLTEFILGERTQERYEFEQQWQRMIHETIKQMRDAGEKYLKTLKENAASNPQAAQELQALQNHRQHYGVEGDITGLLIPKPRLVVPGN